MRMLRKIISLSLVLGLIASSTLTVQAAETYSLFGMLKEAKSNNIKMTLLNTQVDREREDYVAAKAISVSLIDDFDEDDSYTYSDKQKIELNPLVSKKAYMDVLFDQVKKENEIEYDTKNLFYTYFNLKESAESRKDYYAFMDDKKAAKQMELELGQITQLEYDEFVASYESAHLDYLSAKNEMERKAREINIFLKNDPLNEIEISKVDMETINLDTFDMQNISEEIIENSYQIGQLELEKSIQEADKTLKSRYKGFGEKAIELELIEDTILELDSKIEDKKLSLKNELYTKYNNARIAETDIKIKQLEFDLAKRTFEIDEIKFDTGQLSLIDLSESRKEFEDAFFAINSAKLKAYLTQLEFTHFIEENTKSIEVN